METKKILIAEASAEFAGHLCDCLGMDYTLQVCNSGLSVQGRLEDFQPDVLVMDLTLPGMDGISLLKQISTLPLRPRILVTTCFMSPYVETAVASCGVDLVVLKPCKAEILVERIQDLTSEEEKPYVLQQQHGSSIASMLMHLNIPSKRKGFTYLERVIRLYLEQPGQSLTKTLYPTVASEHYTQSEAVERAIRQVVHDSWRHRDNRVWRMYFTPSRDGQFPRPTNAGFIATMAEHYKQAREQQA